ncbi:MAG: hypothetical protein ACFFD4_18250 [Candidatus Odinarchaeota archaeon]
MATNQVSRIICSFVLLFLVLFTISPVSGVVIQNRSAILALTITDASYTVAGNDGIENDALVLFTITVTELRQSEIRFGIRLKLALPSGTSYIYDYLAICTSNGIYDLIAYFYNHATESGNYRVDITITLMRNSATESYIFDPPGSSSGTDPLACNVLVSK